MIDYERVVEATDQEIAKENRLFLLRQVHREWQGKREDKQEEEIKMAKKGVCEQCGHKDKVLKNYYGKDCCASCGSARTAVKNRPEIVKQIIREMHGIEIIEGSGVESAELQVNDSGLQEEIEKWRSFCVAVCRVLSPDCGDEDLNDEYRDEVVRKVESIAHSERVLREWVNNLSDRLGVSEQMCDPVDLEMFMIGLKKALTEISRMMKIEGACPGDVIEAVRGVILSQESLKEKCDYKSALVDDRDRRIVELTGLLLDANNKAGDRSQLMDLALSVVRGDGNVIADNIELLRGRLV